jgi:hypothetical protein
MQNGYVPKKHRDKVFRLPVCKPDKKGAKMKQPKECNNGHWIYLDDLGNCDLCLNKKSKICVLVKK